MLRVMAVAAAGGAAKGSGTAAGEAAAAAAAEGEAEAAAGESAAGGLDGREWPCLERQRPEDGRTRVSGRGSVLHEQD